MLLRAEFSPLALVLVYVGAVMVLFLFVVMMLDITSSACARDSGPTFRWCRGGILMVVEMVLVLGGRYFGIEALPGARTSGRAQATPRNSDGCSIPTTPIRSSSPRAAAGGHHRRDRADAQKAQGHEVPRTRPDRSPSSAATGCGWFRCLRRETTSCSTKWGVLLAFASHFLILARCCSRSALSDLSQPQERHHPADAIELMLLAVNMNFIAFSQYLATIAGQVFVFFILTVAAAESAIGLAILVVLSANLQTINVDDLDTT